ncbi:MAG: signal transduction histidine kinase [Paracoccaceae bacterium]|jgi:signal transduction histidine kinase
MQSDKTKLRQNLFNLLSNAAKFSNGSTISLRAYCNHSSAGELIAFEVQDEGIGMTEEQQENIFEPFTQADSSTSKRFGGTGLGLTITREFSRIMGGDVTVVSQINGGTTFTMKVLVNARPS